MKLVVDVFKGNKENERVETEERGPNQSMTRNISEEETETALKRMKCGKAVGADEIPAEAWEYVGNFRIKIRCKLFNCIMNTEQMPSAWRQSILIPIFKGKGDIQKCKNYRGIKLLSLTFKILERVVDRRIDNARIYMKVSLGSCQVGAQQMRFSY